MVDLNKTLDSANRCSSSAAREEQVAMRRKKGYKGEAAKKIPLVPLCASGMPETAKFVKKVIQAYRILLTRAVRGVYLYINDRETREHVRKLLSV